MWRRIIGIDDNKEEESIERITTPPPLEEATDEQLNQERERYQKTQEEDEEYRIQAAYKDLLYLQNRNTVKETDPITRFRRFQEISNPSLPSQQLPTSEERLVRSTVEEQPRTLPHIPYLNPEKLQNRQLREEEAPNR